MATRCSIKIIGDDNKVQFFYHHYDGYPSGVGIDILTYLEERNQDYDFDKMVIDINSGFVGADPTYEPSEDIHGDENYVYLIDCNSKELKCYKNTKLSWNECDIFIEENLVEIN